MLHTGHLQLGILLLTPCLLPRIREFIHTQHRNTTRSRKPSAILRSVDKFPYPRKQTRGNEFIPCSNYICHILKRFRSFKIPAIPLIWPKSPYKHSVTWSYRSGKESGRRSESPLWRHQWRSFVFISQADDLKREIFHGCEQIRSENQHRAWDKIISLKSPNDTTDLQLFGTRFQIFAPYFKDLSQYFVAFDLVFLTK